MVFAFAINPVNDAPQFTAVQPGIDYFLLFQAAVWIWHPAGASNGLAIAWGPSAAESILHPIRLPETKSRVTVLSHLSGPFVIHVAGNPAKSFTLQSSPSLASSASWVNLLTTNISETSFVFIDRQTTGLTRFYRLRQP